MGHVKLRPLDDPQQTRDEHYLFNFVMGHIKKIDDVYHVAYGENTIIVIDAEGDMDSLGHWAARGWEVLEKVEEERYPIRLKFTNDSVE